MLVLDFQDHDHDEAMQTLPILSDPNFIPAIHRELGPGQTRRWLHPAIQVRRKTGLSCNRSFLVFATKASAVRADSMEILVSC